VSGITSGFIYISSNYGVTWTQTATSQQWKAVAVSASGQYQTAVINNGFLYISTNYGVTWTSTATSQAWRGVAVSASGQYQTAVVNGGFIYTSVTPYSTLAVSNQLTVGNVVTPYVPATSTTTGALVVNGGVGVQGNTFVGNMISTLQIYSKN
jgi:hypothetical protein